MPKSHYTQTVCILLEQPVAIQEIARALSQFKPSDTRPASDNREFRGPSVTLPFRPEVNGYVSVDIVERPWPDAFGDPKEEWRLFGAWALGNFGPFAYPGGLKRASEQCWAWKDGPSIASRHSAFIRIRSSYLFGAVDKDALVMPADYAAAPELRFVTDVAVPLLDLPQSLCYFTAA